MELAVCPFCKAELNDRLDINYNERMEKWVLMHWCNGTDTTIMIVADTKEEVIERWNASQNRKDD